MAVAAGAARVRIGDAGINYLETEESLARTGYAEMARCLQGRNPAVRIEAVNLNRLPCWRWACLGQESSFRDSGYRDDEVGSDFGPPPSNHRYFLTADASGRSPGGRPLGWYAISDVALDADVVINVPKMKTHWTMVVTLSLKELVGCTMASTYRPRSERGPQHVAHPALSRERCRATSTATSPRERCRI